MPTAKKSKKKTLQKWGKQPQRIGKLLIASGTACITIALFIIIIILSPVIGNELSYQFMGAAQTKGVDSVIVPKDPNAAIVIPKIRANAALVLDVDPFNTTIYQQALTKGVAHAKGSAYPGQVGNVFLFSHSSQDLLTANRYNSIFYLLSKLAEGDEIYLFYQGKPYVYTVTGKSIEEPTNVSYLTKKTKSRDLTLMTCWPPGTTLKRFIISATMKP